MKKIKAIFIIMGLASGMTAIGLATLHNPSTCRSVVLKDLKANAVFAAAISEYTASPDFLTALSK